MNKTVQFSLDISCGEKLGRSINPDETLELWGWINVVLKINDIETEVESLKDFISIIINSGLYEEFKAETTKCIKELHEKITKESRGKTLKIGASWRTSYDITYYAGKTTNFAYAVRTDEEKDNMVTRWLSFLASFEK